jgi:hypothetical protein
MGQVGVGEFGSELGSGEGRRGGNGDQGVDGSIVEENSAVVVGEGDIQELGAASAKSSSQSARVEQEHTKIWSFFTSLYPPPTSSAYGQSLHSMLAT